SIACEHVSNLEKWIVDCASAAGAVVDLLHHATASGEDHLRRHADEAVAAPGLTAFDALEQEGVTAIIDLEERRHRSVEVGKDVAIDGHEVSARGELLEFLERGIVDGFVHRAVTKAPDMLSTVLSLLSMSWASARVAKRPTRTRYHTWPRFGA